MLEDRDKFGYEFRDVKIYPIICDTVNLFRKEAKKKEIIIKDPEEIDIPIHFIEMSEPHIRQVIFNIIHNAVKYSFTSTNRVERYITIICKSMKNLYCIEITNYGVGIEMEEISERLIFQSGYRGRLARDRSRIGSGVGLKTVEKIIEDHNGFVEIKSEKMGVGPKIDPYKTTVKVCIPFNQPSVPTT